MSALACAAPASAEVPLQPTEKWVVNFDSAQCIASRNYGTKEKPLHLFLKAPPLGDVIQLGVARSAKSGDAEQLVARVAFDDSPPVKHSMLAFTLSKQKQRFYLINIPKAQFAPAQQARSIAISAKWLEHRFALSSMPALLKTIDSCVANLRKHWNVSEVAGAQDWRSDGQSHVSGGDTEPDNPHRHPALRQGARANLASFFSSADYPRHAIAQDASGLVQFALLVDERGKVADCTVIATSGVASLDAMSCAVLMERARFKPAIGLDGKPAKDGLTGRIRWLLP